MARIAARNRVLLYVSNGYSLEEQPVPPTSVGGVKRPRATRRDLAHLADQARRANVTIFSIDPGGLAGPGPTDPAHAEWLRTTQASLDELSSATGGFAILNTRELAHPLAVISRSVR